MRILQFVILSMLTCLMSCASRPTNQLKNGKKDGIWVYQNKKTSIYSRGKYEQGVEVGVWKYYQGKKMWKREHYNGNVSDVKIYYPNKRISSKGQTQMDISDKEIHWYYTGDWKFYNEQGKLTEIRTYEKGKPIHEKGYR
jgi:antitoxin component YwqK of YwqJK toxin-antitoxin module